MNYNTTLQLIIRFPPIVILGILAYFLYDSLRKCCPGNDSRGDEVGNRTSGNATVHYRLMTSRGHDDATFLLPVTRSIQLASLLPYTDNRRYLPVAESIG